tara:strand:+ start:1115 stop:1315 length:201 start_codon:yes stop_codon:yes gene_type:complete
VDVPILEFIIFFFCIALLTFWFKKRWKKKPDEPASEPEWKEKPDEPESEPEWKKKPDEPESEPEWK